MIVFYIVKSENLTIYQHKIIVHVFHMKFDFLVYHFYLYLRV